MNDYREKLIEFNSTEKYLQEMLFVSMLINARENENVLDYGCGTGAMVKHLATESEANIYGYDNTYYLEGDQPNWWRRSFFFKFHKVYFMHSLAHIHNVTEQLLQLKKEFLFYESKIYVITPNAIWISQQDNPAYIEDKTLIKHFSPKELETLFIKCGYKIEWQGQFGAELNGNHERLFLIAKY